MERKLTKYNARVDELNKKLELAKAEIEKFQQSTQKEIEVVKGGMKSLFEEGKIQEWADASLKIEKLQELEKKYDDKICNLTIEDVTDANEVESTLKDIRAFQEENCKKALKEIMALLKKADALCCEVKATLTDGDMVFSRWYELSHNGEMYLDNVENIAEINKLYTILKTNLFPLEYAPIESLPNRSTGTSTLQVRKEIVIKNIE